MKTYRNNSPSHDASAAVHDKGEILFAGHSERYSRIKNDPGLTKVLLMIVCCITITKLDAVFYYEKRWLKRLDNLKQDNMIGRLH